MLKRVFLIVAVLLTVAVGPWVSTLVIELGKPATMAMLLPLGFLLGSSAVANALENAR